LIATVSPVNLSMALNTFPKLPPVLHQHCILVWPDEGRTAQFLQNLVALGHGGRLLIVLLCKNNGRSEDPSDDEQSDQVG
jgi:hypothetical protein